MKASRASKSHWWHFYRWPRFWLAGPLVFITSVVAMAGAVVWMPAGAARVDNIVLPLVLFPLIWSALFFYASLDNQLKRTFAVVTLILLLNALLIALQVKGGT